MDNKRQLDKSAVGGMTWPGKMRADALFGYASAIGVNISIR